MKRHTVATIVSALLLVPLVACSSGEGSSRGGDGQNGKLTLWTHNAGNVEELAAIQGVVDDYNASQDEVTVSVQAFPQDSYNDSVVAAASAGTLPCIVDIDQPNVPNWAWAEYLVPLDLETDLSTMLPSTQGTWDGKTYSVGYYDVALAFFARQSVLDAHGLRTPTVDAPWTRTELDAALKVLKDSGEWDYPLDINTADVGEWYPYAYSPFLQSFGGDLIDRDGMQSADGALNGPEAVEWATWFQGLVDNGYVALKNGQDPTLDFGNGKSAILYQGSWAAAKTIDALGDDLAILPTVDLGEGSKIGGGSWQWGVTAGCGNAAAAMDYLDFSLKAENVAAVSEATKTIPATDAAAALVADYQDGGRFAVFREMSKQNAVMRPETPAYPYIAAEFTKAVSDILNGGDPQATLDKAVKNIDANIASNGGYK